MKHAIIVSLCFLPLAIIYIVMKVALWLSSSVTEVNYVREDSKREHGPYVENAYADIDEEDKSN